MRVLGVHCQSIIYHDWCSGCSRFHFSECLEPHQLGVPEVVKSKVLFWQFGYWRHICLLQLISYLSWKVKECWRVTLVNCEHIKCQLFSVIPTIIYNRSLCRSCSAVETANTWYASNSQLKGSHENPVPVFCRKYSILEYVKADSGGQRAWLKQ